MSKRSIVGMVAMGLGMASVGAAAWFGGRALSARARDDAAFAAEAQRRPQALVELRAAEEARLRAGPLPIEDAMHRLATRGRRGLGSALQPQPSTDTAPLMGWGFQPHEVPEWMMAAAVDGGQAGP